MQGVVEAAALQVGQEDGPGGGCLNPCGRDRVLQCPHLPAIIPATAPHWLRRGVAWDCCGQHARGVPQLCVFHSLVAPNVRKALPAQGRDTYLLSKDWLAQPSRAWPSAHHWAFYPGRNHLSGEASLQKRAKCSRGGSGPLGAQEGTPPPAPPQGLSTRTTKIKLLR